MATTTQLEDIPAEDQSIHSRQTASPIEVQPPEDHQEGLSLFIDPLTQSTINVPPWETQFKAYELARSWPIHSQYICAHLHEYESYLESRKEQI